MPRSQERHQSPDANDAESKTLSQLLHLINTAENKQKLPAIQVKPCQADKYLSWPQPQPKGGASHGQATETQALEKFSKKYQNERAFSRHGHAKLFSQIFHALIEHRLCCQEWITHAPLENILRLTTCLRIILRDQVYQEQFYRTGGLKVLAEHFTKATSSYLTHGGSPHMIDLLKEMSNIFQKISAVEVQREWLVEYDAHIALMLLLKSNDIVVLHCALHALICLADSASPREYIGDIDTIDALLLILQEYDNLSKKLAAMLMQRLCQDIMAREIMKQNDGIPILLSVLHGDNVNLLRYVVWCLVQLCEDPMASKEIRQMGGIPLILALLHDRKFVTERTEASEGAASAGPHSRTLDDAIWEAQNICDKDPSSHKAEELMEQQYSLKTACCAALTELVMNDANAHEIAQANGIYSLGLLILPPCKDCGSKEKKPHVHLQRSAFRTLRFLFSMERNRKLFKMLFPPDLFEMFISVGHYNRNLKAYKPLVDKINTLHSAKVEEIKGNILETNHNKVPSRYIGEFALFDLLGKGAFGSVYKVKKQTTGTAGQSFLALKEVNMENPMFGRDPQERDQSVGEIMNEITIIREQMKHPNVVRYYKTFVENDHLYIVMELIEGAPLAEHINSMKEKRKHFPEDRVWKIFMQMVLALRYLHKEKGIVHRDLTPNNIMLGDNDDKVTITDFGLAKQKRPDSSKMTSVVGTILYWCPEIIQNLPYTDKADVWALGCIMYQMCTLKPPFFSDNMLTLVTKIADAIYNPIKSGNYSQRLIGTIKSCICKSADARPDIVGVASQMADKLLVHIDSLSINNATMEKKLEKERHRAQRHYFEANENMQNYHRLFQLSQERYDRLANLAGSGGAADLKGCDVLDPGLVDIEVSMSGGLMSLMAPSNDMDNCRVTDGWSSDDDSYPSSCTDSRESSAGSIRSFTRNNSAGSIRSLTRDNSAGSTRSLTRDNSAGSTRSLTRDNSAGSTRSLTRDNSADSKRSNKHHLPSVPKPPMTPKMSRMDRSSKGSNSSFSPLILDIPSTAKTSRDSGISSGDPSPNNGNMAASSTTLEPLVNDRLQAVASRSFNRSNSTPTNNMSRKKKSSKRPNSANTPTLTISHRRVRQISDPIQQMLHQLHKIIYISQLPPTLCSHAKRRVIERYKRALFAPQTTSFNLKSELKKLMSGSREIIDLNLVPDSRKGSASSTRSSEGDNSKDIDMLGQWDSDFKEEGITYEQMQTMIENTLHACGYYSMSPSARDKTLPLAPIASGSVSSSRRFETPR